MLAEAELLRRLNVGQYRAGKLRASGLLTPDQTAQGGRLRLYAPQRVAEIAAKLANPNC